MSSARRTPVHRWLHVGALHEPDLETGVNQYIQVAARAQQIGLQSGTKSVTQRAPGGLENTFPHRVGLRCLFGPDLDASAGW
jgi:hypothetical protein